MKYGPLLGWGIVLYAVVALAWSALAAYGLTLGAFPRVMEFLTLLLVAVIAGRSLGFNAWKDILPYSIGWALVAFLLDSFFVASSGDWQIFGDWSTWAGYALVVLLPLLSPFTRIRAEARGPWQS